MSAKGLPAGNLLGLVSKIRGIVDLTQYLQQEPPHLPLLRLLFKDKSNISILDVGSCEGEDSLRYLKEFPQSRVVAFEPYPENIKKIRQLIGAPFANRFLLEEAAVSDAIGEAVLNISSGHPPGLPDSDSWDYGNKSSSLLAPAALIYRFHPWLRFSKTLRVPTITLDAFAASSDLQSVDFIHMDIQGAELKAMQGAQSLLPRTGVIWLEVSDQSIYDQQPSSGEINAFLTARGFSLVLSCMQGGFGDQLYVNHSYFEIRC